MKVFKKIASGVIALALIVTMFAGAPSLTAEAKGTSGVAIGGAVIEGGNVVVAASGQTASEDGIYHLIASDPNQAGNTGKEVAQAPVAAAANFTFPLNKNSAESVLFKKFTVCVMKGGALTAASNSMYITNPEACGSRAIARMDNGKKGILTDASTDNLGMRTLADLGVKQATVSLPLSKISGGSGVPYVYNGKTYNFDTRYIAAFDNYLGRLNAQGVQVTMILLVDQASQGEFISPYALNGLGKHNYYGLNATTTEGIELLAAAGSFIASRWMSHSYFGMNARVDNFIIGNEVNAWNEWNYMSCGGNLSLYAQEYANAFRVLFNAIKSENANANVYICTDHQWAVNTKNTHGAKAFITQFNNYIRAQGNIDWRLAFHAYDYPLKSATPWVPTANVQRNQNTKFVSIYNIDVVTDFLSQPELLSPSGAVRTVKLSEQGYTSSQGEEIQCAAITFAMLVVNNNSHIDGFILSREKDDPYIEVPQGLAFGLMRDNNTHKLSYDYYKHAGEPEYTAKASEMIGLDLNSLIAPR
ncbi:hypothetical protein SAMN05421493_12328 [Pseudobutyrivibrio sp. 49]|uniref:DUF5722 domain-containing protein n=1 Tax=unclassified Pseudobutyrivibrio TaxID=2638619 RepID=UPI000885725D|nr:MULTISPECIES: DUF5722 domain-containing protein [unclassified Pseudobutyrivibrio]SDI70547.1 hypothetical protein SAMN05421493_12328 [Pseudobutyrivibrio sp. 49]SFO31232.1 hypothetical protein SAMN04487831_11829 [Pseudobutyrivibrio sp. UC1225]